MWLWASTAWPLFELGRWDEVLQVAEDAAAWERPKGGSQLQGITLPQKARVLLFRGRSEEAAEVMDEFLPLARSIHDLQVLLPSLTAAALIERSRGNIGSAVRVVEEWLDARSETNWMSRRGIPEAVEVLATAEAWDKARALIESSVPRCPSEVHAMVTGRALLAEAAGGMEEGSKLFGEAANGWQAYGNVVEQARSLLGTGRCLVALGRLREAARPLRDARAIFSELAATPFVTEADAWLERATALSS